MNQFRRICSKETLMALAAACLLAGCATTTAPAPPPLVAAWTGTTGPVTAAHLGDEPWYPRGEKAVEGPLELSTYSSYSIYTYDPQPIGSRCHPAYRYRSVYQEGTSLP